MTANTEPLNNPREKGWNKNMFSLNRKILLIAGIIPPKGLSESPMRKALFALHLFIWYNVYTPMFLCQVLALFHFWGNIEITTYNLIGLLGASMSYLESTYVRLHSSSMIILIEFLEKKLNSRLEMMDLKEGHIKIIETAKVKARRLTITLIIFLDIMTLSWIPIPYVRKYLKEHSDIAANMTVVQNEDKWLDFCYVIWAPFDITVTPYYEMTYILQIITFIVSIAQLKGLESTIISMLIYTSAHLKTLQMLLREINLFQPTENEASGIDFQLSNDAHSNIADQFVIGYSNQKLNATKLNPQTLSRSKFGKPRIQKDKEFIANFVNYHQAVNEFVQKISETLGPVLFICFFSRQFMACLTLFQMALAWGDNSFIKHLATFFGIMFSQCIFCWYGSEVIENSRLLMQAAFESFLFQRSKEFKNFIIMVMMRSNKVLHFSALGFYTLSLEQFAKTMNGAYAYFTLLKKLQEDQ